MKDRTAQISLVLAWLVATLVAGCCVYKAETVCAQPQQGQQVYLPTPGPYVLTDASGSTFIVDVCSDGPEGTSLTFRPAATNGAPSASPPPQHRTYLQGGSDPRYHRTSGGSTLVFTHAGVYLSNSAGQVLGPLVVSTPPLVSWCD